MTGVGGLCWYEEGDLDPKLDQVVNLPGLSKLRSKRPHDKGEDPEVSAGSKLAPVDETILAIKLLITP
jgi:hypothetical protein